MMGWLSFFLGGRFVAASKQEGFTVGRFNRQKKIGQD
jgi:hypothetical protein